MSSGPEQGGRFRRVFRSFSAPSGGRCCGRGGTCRRSTEEKEMHRFSFVRKPVAVVAIAAAALLVVAGVAYATIPDSGGVIHGCYSRSGGSLRVIDAGVTNCSKSETALDWNV